MGLPDLERKQEKIKAAEFHRVRPDRAGPDVNWPNLPNFVGWKKELGRCHLSACSLPRSRPRYIGRVIEVQPWNNYTADWKFDFWFLNFIIIFILYIANLHLCKTEASVLMEIKYKILNTFIRCAWYYVSNPHYQT